MSRLTRESYVAAILAVAALFYAGTGVWAFAAPQSFYDVIATYPPYNAHFLRDIGAFLIGLGGALLGALIWRDVRFVALLGGTVAAVVHWASHVIDRDHGGTFADAWLTGAFALLLLVDLTLRTAARNTSARTSVPTTTEGAAR